MLFSQGHSVLFLELEMHTQWELPMRAFACHTVVCGYFSVVYPQMERDRNFAFGQALFGPTTLTDKSLSLFIVHLLLSAAS